MYVAVGERHEAVPNRVVECAGIGFGLVEHLDAAEFALGDQAFVDGIDVAFPVGVAGMVPQQEGALAAGLLDGLHLVLDVEFVGILDKERADVPQRLLAGDFRTGDHDHPDHVAACLGQFVGFIEAATDDVGVLVHLDVVGHGDRVQSVVPRFVDPADGPHLSVGDVGMDVEIAFERDIAADVGYAEVLAVVLAADGLVDVDIVVMQLCSGSQDTEKGKKCEGIVFSHRSCSLVVSY